MKGFTLATRLPERKRPMNDIANLQSVEKYRSKAARYDDSAQFTMPLRIKTIARLKLRPGDTVLE